MFRIAQWRRLGVHFMFLLPDVGGSQDAQALSIGGHDAVLDSVMDHLNEVAGAVRTAMQITLLGGAAGLFTSRRARYIAFARSQSGENRIKVLDHRVLTAKHHAVPPLQAPDPTACPNIHVMDSLQRQFSGAPDIVHIIGIAPVNKNVVTLKIRK